MAARPGGAAAARGGRQRSPDATRARSQGRGPRRAAGELRRLERQIAIGMQHTRFDASDLAQAKRRLKDADRGARARIAIRLGRQLQERIAPARRRGARGGKSRRRHAGASDGATRGCAWRRPGWTRSATKTRSSPACRASSTAWRRCGSNAISMFASTDPGAAARGVPARAGRRSIRYRHGASTSTSWSAKRGRNCAPRTRSSRRPTARGLANSPEAEAMQAARYTAAAYERVQTTIDDADRTLKRWIADSVASEERKGLAHARDRRLARAEGRRAHRLGLRVVRRRGFDRGRRPASDDIARRDRGQERRRAALVPGRLLGRRAACPAHRTLARPPRPQSGARAHDAALDRGAARPSRSCC